MLRGNRGEPKYYHWLVGGNFRLDAMQAAVLLVKLTHLAAWTEARQRNAARYRQLFAAHGVRAEQVGLPAERPGVEHVYHQFVVRCAERDKLRAHLQRRAIGSEVYYPRPFHLQECFAGLGHGRGGFPLRRARGRRGLALQSPNCRLRSRRGGPGHRRVSRASLERGGRPPRRSGQGQTFRDHRGGRIRARRAICRRSGRPAATWWRRSTRRTRSACSIATRSTPRIFTRDRALRPPHREAAAPGPAGHVALRERLLAQLPARRAHRLALRVRRRRDLREAAGDQPVEPRCAGGARAGDGRRVYTVLQLRLHPGDRSRSQGVRDRPAGRRHDVELTYFTARGRWYATRGRGSEQSGGVATNIGIHFFDLLIWLFGPVRGAEVMLSKPGQGARSLGTGAG